MPRRPRIEFECAIYHVMARGNARQRIVRDDHDRERLLDDLRRTMLRYGWELLAFVFMEMENHLHLLLKTPRPNLARGMQQFLSSYAPLSLANTRKQYRPSPSQVHARNWSGVVSLAGLPIPPQ